jgi:hypothetical protein
VAQRLLAGLGHGHTDEPQDGQGMAREWPGNGRGMAGEWEVTCQRVANERGKFLLENPDTSLTMGPKGRQR